MTDAIRVLHRDHEEVKAMLIELELGPTAASGADDHQLTLRGQMTEQLITEASRHEAVEEELFWPAVREYLRGGDELADRAAHQEQEVRHTLDRLDKLTPAEEDFETLMAEFIQTAREHIAFEEQLVWPELMRALSVAQLEDLGTRLEQGRMTVLSRSIAGTAKAGRDQSASSPAKRHRWARDWTNTLSR